MWRLAGLRYCALMSVLVRLMGAFSVEVDGQIVDQGDFHHRSAAAVVKILALTPHRRMHREQVMDHSGRTFHCTTRRTSCTRPLTMRGGPPALPTV